MTFAILPVGYILLCLILGLAGAVVKAANLTVPGCNPQTNYDWAFNSLGQSPCYVAAAIRAPCHGDSFTIQPLLSVSSLYDGPNADDSEDFCSCSIVAYSLMNACAACQGSRITPWATWTKDCLSPVAGILNGGIPNDTKVPHWAFQTDVLNSGIWDPDEAHTVGDMPESPDTPNTTSTSLSTSSVPSSTATPSTQATSGADDADDSRPPIATIVGASVGGAAGLGLVAAALYWLRRRRRLTRARAHERVDLVSYMEGPATDSTVVTPFMSMISMPTKYYDPSDPNTYPDAFSASGGSSGPVHSIYNGFPEP